MTVIARFLARWFWMPMQYAPKDGTAIDIWVEPEPMACESGIVAFGSGRRVADCWWNHEWLMGHDSLPLSWASGEPIAWMYPRRMG